ncbi:MAG: hypothetical protein Q7J82_00195 [Coriobacteriia bacterium]|nr:hypothetical protein [Coriobacteriia bacterium]
MNTQSVMHATWERTGPILAGLAWSVPTAMWTGFIVGWMPADTPSALGAAHPHASPPHDESRAFAVEYQRS